MLTNASGFPTTAFALELYCDGAKGIWRTTSSIVSHSDNKYFAPFVKPEPSGTTVVSVKVVSKA